MEFTRLAVVYLHLIACCVAVGLVLTNDLSTVKLLAKGQPIRYDRAHMSELQWSVSVALVALWITGIALVCIDAFDKGLEYFSNPKLQAKVAIVCLLTLNGFLLHGAVMPAMQKAGSLLHLSFSRHVLAVFAGSVSAISWFYAAMLGVGRPLNWNYTLPELLVAYPFLIVAGTLGMLVLTAWAQYSRRASNEIQVGQLTMAALKIDYSPQS